MDSITVPGSSGDDLFSRNRLWQSHDLAQFLESCDAVIGGVGGTGWYVGSQLIGLGVRNITVFDPDSLDASNLNRIWGCSLNDVGKPKVQLFKERVSLLGVPANIHPVLSRVPCLDFEAAVSRADVVFGCYDMPEPRLATQVLCRMYKRVYVDSGAALLPTGNSYRGHGQVFLYPGAIDVDPPCILCGGLRLDSPGYLSEVGDTARMPSAAPLNMVIAGLAVSVWLKLLTKTPVAPLIAFDWNSVTLQSYEIERRNDCPICSERLDSRYLDHMIG